MRQYKYKYIFVHLFAKGARGLRCDCIQLIYVCCEVIFAARYVIVPIGQLTILRSVCNFEAIARQSTHIICSINIPIYAAKPVRCAEYRVWVIRCTQHVVFYFYNIRIYTLLIDLLNQM